MKICRDCSNACDNAANACPRCGSTNLALVAEKHCVYCKTRVAMGTIICPHCHRILPPESEDVSSQNSAMIAAVGGNNQSAAAQPNVGLANVNASDANAQAVNMQSGNIQYVQPITHISETQPQENAAQNPSPAVQKQTNTSGISDYDKQNPLFTIYDKAPDILAAKPQEETAEPARATTYQENIATDDSLQTDVSNLAEVSESSGYNNAGILQTKSYQTQRISREETKPQSKLPRILIFILGCIYTAVGLFTTYMTHDYGNIIGWEMACSIIIALRDVFPSVYPYILYGSSFLSKFEVYGSYMPFFMDHAIMFSLFAGITLMISAVPKWVTAFLHIVVLGCHIGGAVMMYYLFGIGAIGVGAYVFIGGSFAVAVLHMIFVKRVYKMRKIK